MNDAVTTESPTPESLRPDSQALEQAIARGAAAVKREQRPDGSWDDDTDLGPSATAMHWIAEAALGGASPEAGADAAAYLLSQQQADGSFLPFPEATAGTASATALCRAGLLACGLPASHAGV
ncbi:MAG TPA: prenyltransferase/squalene oxidase repeat-containing protein, partial [Polyangiaceae bacterium]|nr:prenyltransferase/squalene oxidase repeat-containing protein [Polyangiaceae bacterium]